MEASRHPLGESSSREERQPWGASTQHHLEMQVLPLFSCGTLGKSLSLCMPQAPCAALLPRCLWGARSRYNFQMPGDELGGWPCLAGSLSSPSPLHTLVSLGAALPSLRLPPCWAGEGSVGSGLAWGTESSLGLFRQLPWGPGPGRHAMLWEPGAVCIGFKCKVF